MFPRDTRAEFACHQGHGRLEPQFPALLAQCRQPTGVAPFGECASAALSSSTTRRARRAGMCPASDTALSTNASLRIFHTVAPGFAGRRSGATDGAGDPAAAGPARVVVTRAVNVPEHVAPAQPDAILAPPCPRRKGQFNGMTGFPAPTPSKAFYQRKRDENKVHARALLALARRLVDVLWALLRDNRVYSPVPPSQVIATAA